MISRGPALPGVLPASLRALAYIRGMLKKAASLRLSFGRQASGVLALLVLGTISIARINVVELRSPSQPSTQQELQFDGIGVGLDNVTLIRQLDGCVILQGKDHVPTWWAKGAISICQDHVSFQNKLDK